LLSNCDVGTKEAWTNNSQQREKYHRKCNKCCDKEAEQKYLCVPITKATARAAKYCDVSSRTIQRIRQESNTCVVDGELSTPGKARKRPNVRNAEVDDFDRRVIKDVIEDFYLRQKVVPTCKKLLPCVKGKN
jgi:hypothetical protein